MSSTTRMTTAADQTPILIREWSPAGAPWAAVLLVHGLAEHSGRYEHVGGWMADEGLSVSAYDLRGFGASGGRRAWADRWSRHHDDLEERLAEVRAAAAGRPVALYGHSLGALIVAGYAVSDTSRPLPDALVLSAPAIADSVPRWRKATAPAFARVAPEAEVRNPFDGAILSRDPTVAERYLADPLNYHRTTTRFGADMFAEQARVSAALDRLTVPTLVYHGEDDRLVPTDGSRPFGDLPIVTRRTYPGLRHESHNEPEGAAVIADVVAWLRVVLESAATEDSPPGSA